MGGLITKDQREQRMLFVLSFIFLFRFVAVRELNLLGSILLGVNDMRRTIESLLRNRLIKDFEITSPVKTTGYYLLEEGLVKLPKPLLEYKYFFFPTRYKPSIFAHGAGVIQVFFAIQKLAAKGYWVSEWMIRQDKIKTVGKKAVAVNFGWRKKGVLNGRMPDGMFVVGKKARVAIEFESTLKNNYDWEGMIRNLEYGLRAREKVDLVTKDIVTGRDFEAVLFVFYDNQTFTSYLRKFDRYSRIGKGEMLDLGILNEAISLKRYFLSTLDELKKGHVFRTKGEKVILSEMFNFVETMAATN